MSAFLGSADLPLTIGRTPGKHIRRVVANAAEYCVISRQLSLVIFSLLHRSADHDVALPAEYIHHPVVRAATAEEIKLLGVRLAQDDQMSAACDHLLIVHQRLGAIPRTVDDDVFLELTKGLSIR